MVHLTRALLRDCTDDRLLLCRLHHQINSVWELSGGGELGEGSTRSVNVFNPIVVPVYFVLGVRCNPHKWQLQRLTVVLSA